MDLIDPVIDDTVVVVTGPDCAVGRKPTPSAWIGDEDPGRIAIIDQMVGNDRAGLAAREAERVARSAEIVAGALVSFEDELVTLRLVPVEVEHAMPAVRTV